MKEDAKFYFKNNNTSQNMNPRFMIKVARCSLYLILLFSLIPIKSIATPTKPLKADCTWNGNDGEIVNQKCILSANSSAGFGSSVNISWQDGYSTHFRSPPQSSIYKTPSGVPVKLEGQYLHDRFLFPRKVTIQDQGVIIINYEGSEKCLRAEQEISERLSRDNITYTNTVDIRSLIKSNNTVFTIKVENNTSSYKSPTSRQDHYIISFAGRKARDFMNSFVLQKELAVKIANSCEDTAMISFWLLGSGYSVVYGKEASGELKRWGCYEDIGYFPGRRKNIAKGEMPNWGYYFCSI